MHGGWARGDGSHLGDVQFNAKTSEYFRANIQFPFFEHYLKGKGSAPAKAMVFETGTNVWRIDGYLASQAGRSRRRFTSMPAESSASTRRRKRAAWMSM